MEIRLIVEPTQCTLTKFWHTEIYYTDVCDMFMLIWCHLIVDGIEEVCWCRGAAFSRSVKHGSSFSLPLSLLNAHTHTHTHTHTHLHACAAHHLLYFASVLLGPAVMMICSNWGRRMLNAEGERRYWRVAESVNCWCRFCTQNASWYL